MVDLQAGRYPPTHATHDQTQVDMPHANSTTITGNSEIQVMCHMYRALQDFMQKYE